MLGIRLEQANFVAAVFDGDTKWPAGFDPLTAGATKA
jgi:hypothetical protein